MDSDLTAGLLMLIFFTAGLGFWTYSWWTDDRSASHFAMALSYIFCLGGLAAVVIWWVTIAQADR